MVWLSFLLFWSFGSIQRFLEGKLSRYLHGLLKAEVNIFKSKLFAQVVLWSQTKCKLPDFNIHTVTTLSNNYCSDKCLVFKITNRRVVYKIPSGYYIHLKWNSSFVNFNTCSGYILKYHSQKKILIAFIKNGIVSLEDDRAALGRRRMPLILNLMGIRGQLA